VGALRGAKAKLIWLIIFDQLRISLKNNRLQAKNIFIRCLHVVVLYITISPSHRNTAVTDRTETKGQETIMNTSISTKLAALALALMVNSVIMGGIAYLFNAQLQGASAVTSLVSTATPSANAA
jgi:hypothetical protein